MLNKNSPKKVLIITYYWPPSGGSGVQRWMYFAKYLKEFGYHPIVLTVDEKTASYKFTDWSLLEEVKDVEVYKTRTFEPLKIYSYLLSGNKKSGIPQGFAGEKKPGYFQQLSRFVRGNFFIPDARAGWNRFAFEKAKKIIKEHSINKIITTGPPHSTHLIGLKLKEKFKLKWISDFRDPWTEIYYNEFLHRSKLAKKIDGKFEKAVLNKADIILTVGPSMAKLLQQKMAANMKSKVHFIYNGFDDKIKEKIRPVKNKTIFTICHIGLLGELQPIEPFLKALRDALNEKKIDQEKIKLKFIGKVSFINLKAVETFVPHIDFEVIDYMPHLQAVQEMFNADLLLNSLAESKHSKLLISGKLMEYLSSGNPILGLGNSDSDASEILKEFDNAAVFERSDNEGIKDFLIIAYSNWKGGKITKQEEEKLLKYSRKRLTEKLVEMIKID